TQYGRGDASDPRAPAQSVPAKPLGPLLAKMDAFRLIEPRMYLSEINRPIPFPPSAPWAISAQSTTRRSPQDRTKTAKVSEHRRRAPIQFMLNKTSQAG